MKTQLNIFILLLVVILSAPVFGQEEPGRGRGRGEPPPPPPGEGRDGRGPRITPEQRQLEQLQLICQCDDVEWAVLAPKIARVQTLIKERERLTHLKPPPPAPRPDGPPPPEDAPKPGQIVVETPPDMQRNPPIGQGNIKLAQMFREMATRASSTSTPTTELKDALERYRSARVQAEKEIAEARKVLRELVTPRQEVILVLAGILD